MHETIASLARMPRERPTFFQPVLEVIEEADASVGTTCSCRQASAVTPGYSVETTASVAPGAASEPQTTVVISKETFDTLRLGLPCGD